MISISSKIILTGTTVILTIGILGGSAFEPVTGKQSAVKQLGHESDFEKTGRVLLPNPRAWGKVGKSGSISYRMLKAKAKADLLIAAFDVDDNGFCKHDMILEMFYRDDIKQRQISKHLVRGRLVIQSRIDFSKDNEYVEVGHLKAEADNKWKLARIFLERTPRQMLRVIDGSFRFKIVTPESDSKGLPISYIRLTSIEHEEFLKLREEDRAKRGLERIDYKPPAGFINIPEKWKGSSFVVYPVNYLKLVFPNSPVDYDRVGDELKCFEVAGQVEPVSFVIYAFEDMSDVQVNVSDLRSGTNKISAGRIDIRRVICNDQRWNWGWAKRYGLCPDYLSLSNQITNIKANTNCQFLLTITIPENTTPGSYTGKVTISSGEKPIYYIPLVIEVLPIRLLEDRVEHIIYHSPFFKNYQKDQVAILQDMRSHGLTPIFYPKGRLIKTRTGELTVYLDSFERNLELFKNVYPRAKTIFVRVREYGEIWRRLNGPEPPFEHHFPRFESTYSRFVLSHANVIRKQGLEPIFCFVDEPGSDPSKRRIAYLCSSIAKKAGLKTWAPTYPESDEQLPLSADEKRRNINYLRPLSEVLDVFVSAIRTLDEDALKKMEQRNVTVAYYTTYVCTSVRPVYNRVLNGIYAHATNAKYVLSLAYRDSYVDPYDDCDVSSEYSDAVGMNDYLLTYPTWKGDILPTLSYEALREGIEDSQLISALQILAERALKAEDADTKNLGMEVTSYLNGVLKRLSKDFKQRYWGKQRDLPVDNMEKAILRDLNAGQSEDYEIFDKIRRDICDRIIELQGVLAQ